MRHIALVTTSYPSTSIQPGRDAAGSFVADFAATLAQHVQVTVVAPNYASSIERLDRLTVHRFATPKLPLSLLSPANFRHWRAILTTLVAGQHTLQRVCRESQIDHVFALWALPSGYWARIVWKQQHIPYSVWALGSDIWSLGKIPFIRKLLQTILQDSHICFADGYHLQQDVETISGRACEFLPSVRHLPVTWGKRLASAPPYKLAYLGRWHPHKGVDLLLASLQQLDTDDWRKIQAVRICGGGPLEQIVQTQSTLLAAAGRPVTVEGYLSKAESAALFTWADYVLLPSRLESIPVVFSDAMQCSCPIVCTPVGDLPRLINEYNVGVTSAAVDATSFAHALRTIVRCAPSDFQQQLERAANAFNLATAVQMFLRRLAF